ncbi:hypothetical protein PybrP1_002835, partial [[Pythium] brassicae (nom. inval.)]
AAKTKRVTPQVEALNRQLKEQQLQSRVLPSPFLATEASCSVASATWARMVPAVADRFVRAHEARATVAAPFSHPSVMSDGAFPYASDLLVCRDAKHCYTQATRVKPTFAIAWSNLEGLLVLLDAQLALNRVLPSVQPFHALVYPLSLHAARRIHRDGIHVLVNLNGYTKGARNKIFALRPAPLQVSYMGFCGTLGADYVQYMVGDAVVVPPAHRRFFTEKIISMPHSYFVNDHRQSARDVLDAAKCPTRAHYGVPEDAFVFCNFNQVYKIDPATFATWMNILKRVPSAILWLLRFPPLAEANIRAEAAARGVKAHRLHFTDVAPKDEHLKRGYLADLFLDTPECNAHTTGCDILWGGTPLVTMAKERMASRVASSLLRAANLGELVTCSLEEYEELAVALASDMDKLWELRRRLEDDRDRCPLFDTQRWVRNLETGLSMAWERHESGQDPEHIDSCTST